MSLDLNYYRLLPYEREWVMREGGGQPYYVVRLKDLPAVAGDGSSRDEAAADLREAFDEFIAAWLEAGRAIPEPSRGYTVPGASSVSPVSEWPAASPFTAPELSATPSWMDNAELLSNLVLVEQTSGKPSLEETPISA